MSPLEPQTRRIVAGPTLPVVPGRLVSAFALLGLAAACSFGTASIALPDRASSAVKQEEARIAAVLAADASGKLLSRPLDGPAECRVRLLRHVGTVDYVWAECTAGQTGVSVPVRLAGRTVTVPEDGSGYAASLRRVFPSDVAAALLADAERYRP